ncbi:aminoglycoside phosphotransferase family protein [Halobacteriales archaeon QS_5_70_17]|nr:MAG: aminoglycoside phosphotransferase family protein [Halobacteriales archaeon QS_5_70_17]
MTGRTAIDAETVGNYLRDRDVLPADATTEAEPLGGGVSNAVVRVRTGGDCLVVKQPFPNLAVEDDWPADVTRVHNEASAARAYRGIADRAGLPVRVPRVVFEDASDHVVALECAPESAVTWKCRLLDGAVDADVARTLGRFLGESHAAAADDEELAERFGNKEPFRQLRLDPYHRTVARRHPDVADPVEREIERIEGVERTLVHGDFSPKNVLVADGAPWLLDFEVAHWGDPAFDTAFLLNHLLIKSVHVSAAREDLLAAARAFRSAYRERAPWDVERATVRELAVLMLARVDGKSPVEYAGEEIREVLRSTAKRALRSGVTDFEAYVDCLVEAS